MPSQLVQATTYLIDVVDIGEPGGPASPITNATHRIRVRERYTYIAPKDADLPDPCRGRGATIDELELPTAANGITYVQTTREIELAYEMVGPGNVGIRGDRIVFENAGLRCHTAACGPAYADSAGHLSSLVLQGIANFYETSASDDERYDQWNNYLALALGENYWNLFPDNRSPDVEAVDDVGRRVYYFHVDACLPVPEPEQALMAAALTDSVALFGGAYPLPDPTVVEFPQAIAGQLRPIIYFPFVEEAFAFGAITEGKSLRLFGRMGRLTRGYRVSTNPFWRVFINEKLPLTFAEDIHPDDQKKYAELDAGPLPPSDFNLGLDNETVFLHAEPVPFYVGAMPLVDPALLSLEELERLDGGQFCYLTAELDTPIIFDPMANCGSCAA